VTKEIITAPKNAEPIITMIKGADKVEKPKFIGTDILFNTAKMTITKVKIKPIIIRH
jgi:hypothetical protein